MMTPADPFAEAKGAILAIRDVWAEKIRKRGVVQTLMRIAEYALTLLENRDALVERRRREDGE